MEETKTEEMPILRTLNAVGDVLRKIGGRLPEPMISCCGEYATLSWYQPQTKEDLLPYYEVFRGLGPIDKRYAETVAMLECKVGDVKLQAVVYRRAVCEAITRTIEVEEPIYVGTKTVKKEVTEWECKHSWFETEIRDRSPEAIKASFSNPE